MPSFSSLEYNFREDLRSIISINSTRSLKYIRKSSRTGKYRRMAHLLLMLAYNWSGSSSLVSMNMLMLKFLKSIRRHAGFENREKIGKETQATDYIVNFTLNEVFQSNEFSLRQCIPEAACARIRYFFMILGVWNEL